MQRCAFIFCNSNIYSIYSRCSLTLLLRHNHSEFVHDFSVIKRTLHSGCTQLKHLHAIFSLQLPDGLLGFLSQPCDVYVYLGCSKDSSELLCRFPKLFFFFFLSSPLFRTLLCNGQLIQPPSFLISVSTTQLRPTCLAWEPLPKPHSRMYSRQKP